MKQSVRFKTDSRLNIIAWGDSLDDLTGTAPSMALGKKYSEVMPSIIVDNKDALLTALRQRKKLTCKGYSFRCFNGAVKADLTIRPFKAKNGRTHEIEVEMRPHSYCPMTRKLEESQPLIEIGKIASFLAHGVRNPLNAIKGAVVYIREKNKHDPSLLEFTSLMEEEIARLDSFISRFLSTSLSKEAFSLTDINELVKKIEVLTALQSHAKGVKAVFHYGTPPPLLINFFQLEQAILNIINNAIESMPSGGELLVKTETANISGANYALITISDQGKGTAPKSGQDITLSRHGTGRGFGLFITREVVQSHGGSLEIQSKAGRGTSIKIYLPAGNPKGL